MHVIHIQTWMWTIYLWISQDKISLMSQHFQSRKNSSVTKNHGISGKSRIVVKKQMGIISTCDMLKFETSIVITKCNVNFWQFAGDSVCWQLYIRKGKLYTIYTLCILMQQYVLTLRRHPGWYIGLVLSSSVFGCWFRNCWIQGLLYNSFSPSPQLSYHKRLNYIHNVHV